MGLFAQQARQNPDPYKAWHILTNASVLLATRIKSQPMAYHRHLESTYRITKISSSMSFDTGACGWYQVDTVMMSG